MPAAGPLHAAGPDGAAWMPEGWTCWVRQTSPPVDYSSSSSRPLPSASSSTRESE
jgi:hypothetical protein